MGEEVCEGEWLPARDSGILGGGWDVLLGSLPSNLKLFQLTLAAAVHTHCGITTDVACCLPGASSVPPGKQLQGWKWLVLSWLVESLSLHSLPCIQPLPTPRYQAPH